MTKKDYRSHSMIRNTTSCKRILYKPGPALQTSAGKLITLQIIFQILYCHKYKHEGLKKPIKFLNETNSTYPPPQYAKSGVKTALSRLINVQRSNLTEKYNKQALSHKNPRAIRQLIRFHLFGVRFSRVLSRDF